MIRFSLPFPSPRIPILSSTHLVNLIREQGCAEPASNGRGGSRSITQITYIAWDRLALSEQNRKEDGKSLSRYDFPSEQRLGSFEELFDSDKNRLYAYIYAFVSNKAAADDIFQETSLTLWHNFDKFEAGTNFSKWANVIAFNRVRHFRQKQKKYMLGLSEDFLKEFSENVAVIESEAAVQEKKWRHLEHCRSSLSEPMKNIYQSFYVENLTAKDIAERTGRSIHAIRKSVHKLRQKLFDCVEQKTQEELS